jgi:hypothetical protein
MNRWIGDRKEQKLKDIFSRRARRVRREDPKKKPAKPCGNILEFFFPCEPCGL